MDNRQPTVDEANFEQLAAALNNHQITDEDGAINAGEDETPAEEPAASQPKSTEDDTPRAEKSAVASEPDTQDGEGEDQDQLGVDDSGNRYVPEKRFKGVYGKLKATERELEAIKAAQQQVAQESAPKRETARTQTTEAGDEPSKADVIELKLELPQFDPKYDENGVSQNPDYSPELDQLGYQIYKANPGISLVEAGRQAIRYAKNLSKQVAEAQAEARTVKTIQSDRGIAGRQSARGETEVSPENMSLEQMEEFLKANGQW